METSTDPHNLTQEIDCAISPQIATSYIQEQHPNLSPERSYIPQANYPDQLWQLVAEDSPTYWVFFSTTPAEQPQAYNSSEERASLELILEDMLLSDHLPNQTLSLELREALETERLTAYRLHLCVNQDDPSLISISQTEIDLSRPQVSELQPTPDLGEPLSPSELSPETAQDTEFPPPAQPVNPLTLQQQAKQLSQQLSPPGFPIYSKLNSKLPTTSEIKAIQDRYGRTTELSLEYSPAIPESELLDHFQRLGHYQSLRNIAHLHLFIQEQMQTWHKQNGQPSPGAIAPYLQQHIIELRDHLHQYLQTLTDNQLQSITAQTLQIELSSLNNQQQQQQALLDQLEQNPLLGYLDVDLLAPNHILPPIQPFADSIRPLDIHAQHLKRKNDRIILTLISPCHSKKYKAYHQHRPNRPASKIVIEYTLTQKLYPQRPVFIGPAPKAVYPRLELLWGDTNEPIMNPNPLTQIWCIYPMIRTDPSQWLIIAATTDTQPLQTITLENGQIAQEGTYAYLERSLQLMVQTQDEYTHTLGELVTEALAQQRVKYLHLHQTQNLQTGKPRDILQMQFQLLS